MVRTDARTQVRQDEGADNGTDADQTEQQAVCLGPTGHLSNEQTGQALIRVLDDGPRWLWLAHLSRTNNTPDIARAAIRQELRQLGLRHIQPQPLPHEFGPVWDSAALWNATADAQSSATSAIITTTAVTTSE